MTLIRRAGRLLPDAARRRAASGWRAWTGAAVRRELARIGASGRPVVLGPWLGEVGFELLYWLPFLEWALSAERIDRARVVAVSRGGTAAWYRRVAGRYRDVFDLLTPEEFRRRNQARALEVGEQKQTRLTSLESDLLAEVARLEGLRDPVVLHPGLMHRLFNPYWWGHADERWVREHARFALLPEPSPLPWPLPDAYVAVKFYYNDAFPPTPENRACAARVLRDLANEGPVVSLATGLRLDDHAALEEEAHHPQPVAAGAASMNLAAQDAIVSRARAWVGTYGGFAYLAPFRGVPARAYYSDPDGFSRRHLDLAQSVFAGFGSGLLALASVHDAPRLAVAR